MNAVGYDAMTLGNHEFDYGSDVTMERIKQAKFPIVSANIIVDATGKPFTGKTHAIIRKGDLKIGVFGLTTPSTITTSNPKSTRGLTFRRRPLKRRPRERQGHRRLHRRPRSHGQKSLH